MNITNPQQVIDDFERLLLVLTEKPGTVSLYNRKSSEYLCPGAARFTRHNQNNLHLKKSNKIGLSVLLILCRFQQLPDVHVQYVSNPF